MEAPVSGKETEDKRKRGIEWLEGHRARVWLDQSLGGSGDKHRFRILLFISLPLRSVQVTISHSASTIVWSVFYAQMHGFAVESF